MLNGGKLTYLKMSRGVRELCVASFFMELTLLCCLFATWVVLALHELFFVLALHWQYSREHKLILGNFGFNEKLSFRIFLVGNDCWEICPMSIKDGTGKYDALVTFFLSTGLTGWFLQHQLFGNGFPHSHVWGCKKTFLNKKVLKISSKGVFPQSDSLCGVDWRLVESCLIASFQKLNVGWFAYLSFTRLPNQNFIIDSTKKSPHRRRHKGRPIWARGDNVNWTRSRLQVIFLRRGGVCGHPGILAWARERPNWWPNLRGGGREANVMPAYRGRERGRSPGQVSLGLNIKGKKCKRGAQRQNI